MALLDEIDALIDERHLLTHPFYVRWVAGTLPVEALRTYVQQYYAFESAFPRFLSAIHSRCERADIRQTILDNLWDEELGEENHAELWLRFAEGVGVARSEVAGATPNPATRALVDTYFRAATEGPLAAGLAAIHAYERQVPAVAAAKIASLRAHYGIDDPRTLAFWEVHQSLDEQHAGAERAILAQADGEDRPVVLRATSRALEAWWRFLEAADLPG
ncbi:MAG: CADD family putative folate metabolism protein [Acidimicrobiia bacterium]